MGKKFTLQILIIMILLFSLPSGVIAVEEVDFGSVAASRILVVARNVAIIIPETSHGVFIGVSNGLTSGQNGLKIPMERITLFWGHQTIRINQPQTFIDFKEISPEATANLKLNIELCPMDRPGCYTGEILLQFWKPDPENPDRRQWLSQSPTAITIKVNIEAWVNLQIDSHFVKLEPTTNYAYRCLQNPESLILRLASNTDWVVYLEINGAVVPGLMFIKTKGLSRDYRGIEQMVISPFQGIKPVATGTATANEIQYWREIRVNLSINDFIKYPAGKYRFKLHFTGEIYNEKSAVDF